jgi:hypothetical protein
MQGLLQRVEHEAGVCGPGYAPADDATGIGVDDEGDIDEARPGADRGEVREPKHVRRRRMEDPVHMIERAWRSLVGHRGAQGLAADNTVQTRAAHQARHGAASELASFSLHLPPDLAHAIDLEVLVENPFDLRQQGGIAPRSDREFGRIATPRGRRVVG